ncbi:MAG: hypothetical protein LC732_08120 [Acidobacteria bacterium]|nr:hypothetical protein [Acidobacteriota bacterium]
MSDRKYRHNGYQDSGVEKKGPRGPRPDMPPRPERVEGAPRGRSAGGFGPQAFKCARCGEKQHSWDDLNVESTCARCKDDLHTCTNCQHFDTSFHWQCRLAEQLPDRVSPKDVRNLCALYTPRLVADLAADKSKAETPDDARKAFEALFKK